MAFSEGISRLQKIIGFISIDYRTKKEIMAHLRSLNIVISYKTLERDLKQLKEELGFELEYKRDFGYLCTTKTIVQAVTADSANFEVREGFENEVFRIIHVFEYNGKTYCNCIDKSTEKLFLMG